MPMLTRMRHTLNVLRGRSDAHWSAAQINQINYEMAEGLISEIGEVLEAQTCCHGKNAGHGTAPMFYPEAIRCCIKAAYDRGRIDGQRDVQ